MVQKRINDSWTSRLWKEEGWRKEAFSQLQAVQCSKDDSLRVQVAGARRPAAAYLDRWVGHSPVWVCTPSSKWQDKSGLLLVCVSLDSCGLDRSCWIGKSLIIHPNKSGLPGSWLVVLGYSYVCVLWWGETAWVKVKQIPHSSEQSLNS